MTNKTRRGSVIKAILEPLVEGATIATQTIVAQSMALRPWLTSHRSLRCLAVQRYYWKTVIGRLTRRGLIKWQKRGDGKTYLRITAAGKQELLKYKLRDLEIKKPRWWDGQWRIIIFDIREYQRKVRDRLRRELTRFGFQRLQDSVWIYPYDCEELIMLLKSDLRLGRDLLYLLVKQLENDRWLRRSFGLD